MLQRVVIQMSLTNIFINTIFKGIDMLFSKPKKTERVNWADNELKRTAADLETKRKVAIEYLGDKWILKGGTYNRSNVLLGQK